MPEQMTSTAIVPSSSSPVEGEYQIKIRELDASGRGTDFIIPVPTTITSNEASVMLRSAVLKKTTWKNFDFPTILHAVMYSDRMGLDIMAGDVYSAEGGRLSTTAGAKIRHAMTTGRIEGYDVQITDGPIVKLSYRVKDKDYVWEGPNLKAHVEVYVKGWKKPVTYDTSLEEWFIGTNPNWRSRPSYMLRRNALSKALEEVAPMGVEADEAPPLSV